MTLKQYLADRQITTQQFAAKIGASYAITAKWRQGNIVPRRQWVIKIHKITKGKVRAEDWYR